MFISEDDKQRKDAPMFRGLLGYFPAALFEVAAHSLDSDRKHGGDKVPGAPHWMRGASTDHEDCIVRHLVDAGPRRTSRAWTLLQKFLSKAPGFSSAKDARRYALRCLAWRALALLQEDCEADGALAGVSSVFPEPEVDYCPDCGEEQCDARDNIERAQMLEDFHERAMRSPGQEDF